MPCPNWRTPASSRRQLSLRGKQSEQCLCQCPQRAQAIAVATMHGFAKVSFCKIFSSSLGRDALQCAGVRYQGYTVTGLGTLVPLSMNHTLRTMGDIPFGVLKGPSMICLTLKGDGSTRTTLFSATCCCRDSASRSQLAAEKPEDLKKAALCLPSRCVSERRVPCYFGRRYLGMLPVRYLQWLSPSLTESHIPHGSPQRVHR